MLAWITERWFIEALLITIGAIIAAGIACKIMDCCQK